jgi:ribonuclease P/MRP protein subunit RPP40
MALSKESPAQPTCFEFLEKATLTVDKGEAFNVVYLNSAKAFDKVPHQRLLKKKRAHGITGELLRWVESWLSNRRQRVVLNGKFSTCANVLSGVPQGSMLGPLLFIIFLNNINEAVEEVEIIKKLADDTKMGQSMVMNEDREKLQQALDNLCMWAVRATAPYFYRSMLLALKSKIKLLLTYVYKK